MEAGATTMAILYADRATAQAADTVRRARLRADYRLATQVLTRGQPAVKQQWALKIIGSCGENAVDAIARALRESRSATTRTGALDGLVYQASTVIGPGIASAARKVATDLSAGKGTRVQALRILSFQVNPGSFASYDTRIFSNRVEVSRSRPRITR